MTMEEKVIKNLLTNEKMLSHIKDTPFLIQFTNGESFHVGSADPVFQIRFNKEIPKKDLSTSTSLALGEAYMRKDIEIEGDLLCALDCLMQSLDDFSVDKKILRNIIKTSTRKANQKKEVSSHYDIGNDFYKLWLDESLSYSCAYFSDENINLCEAQMAKIKHSLDKLYLSEDMTLLDIGCGWGGLLIEAAKTYQIKGIGITLSKEQCEEANRRIQTENLSHQIEVKLMDYRDIESLNQTFDRVVSIGMIEHVGRGNYNKFLKHIHAILNPGGLLLLHSITGRKENDGDPWIKKYIFPGGVVPSLRELIYQGYETEFLVRDVESLRLHYHKTLLHWYQNFQDCKSHVEKMMGEEFTRMWEIYLGCCAASFRCANIDIHQILMTKGCNNDIPIIRV